MTSPPLVSIIIPCYNAAPRLEACLKSCLEQVYSNLEIIFVDNNSTDDSLAIAHQFTAIAPFRFEVVQCEQKGANYARNMGFTQAQGAYIQWLDADDELAPDKIALQVAALAGKGAEWIACADWEWHYYQAGEFKFCLSFAQLCWEDTLLQCLIHHWHPPHAYLLHRAMADQLHQLQAWYPGAPIANDREYMTTAAVIGGQFLPVPGARVRYYTWSSSQLTLSTSYEVKIQSMRGVGGRLRERMFYRSWRSTSGLHWALLGQSWEVWELATHQMKSLSEGFFWLEGTEDGIGMTLTQGEARIVLAMSQLKGAATLNDQACRILRVLWKQVALREGMHEAQVEQELAKWVGLLPNQDSLDVSDGEVRSPEQLALSAMIDRVPLYAPMFPEVRLAILLFLERLRRVGLLRQVVMASGEEQVLARSGSDF